MIRLLQIADKVSGAESSCFHVTMRRSGNDYHPFEVCNSHVTWAGYCRDNGQPLQDACSSEKNLYHTWVSVAKMKKYRGLCLGLGSYLDRR